MVPHLNTHNVNIHELHNLLLPSLFLIQIRMSAERSAGFSALTDYEKELHKSKKIGKQISLAE